ncbi:hypothetical protein P171DRAFT_53847 [Karstenula rhodostoma CBS 690.94]|uniref:Uncharacterized protein n=1 Tax=Karstenula rhodostoma CBS 690.94 TaxID=1392251 RepID=A0A9P4PFD3_9PLEO|nr:hypothetical protein P171DRAFT_53847 [Karstenula rhodostoma CBS 690.94]
MTMPRECMAFSRPSLALEGLSKTVFDQSGEQERTKARKNRDRSGTATHTQATTGSPGDYSSSTRQSPASTRSPYTSASARNTTTVDSSSDTIFSYPHAQSP